MKLSISQILSKISINLASQTEITANLHREVENDIAESSVNKVTGGLDIDAKVGYNPSSNVPITDPTQFVTKEWVEENGTGGVPEPTSNGNWIRNFASGVGNWVLGITKNQYDIDINNINQSIGEKVENIWTEELQDLYPTTGELALNDTLEEAINKLNNNKISKAETITAGEALSIQNIVYLDTDGKWRRADNLIEAKIKTEVRIVGASIANNANGLAIKEGLISGFSGLIIGANYYIGNNGGIIAEANIPETDGLILRYVGTAKSATELHFNPDANYFEIKVIVEEQTPPTPSTDLTATKAIFDQHWVISDGKPNADGTGTQTSGSSVKSIIGKTSAIGGRAIYIDESEAAITQQIPTRPNGGVPVFINQEGGYLHIANGLDIQYRFASSLGDIAATGEFWYVCRLHSGKRYEAIMSGDRGPELKRFNTGQMQFNCNDFVTGNHVFNYEPVEYETLIFHFIYNQAAGTVNIRVTDSVGDYRNLTTTTIPTTSFLRNFGVGTSSHPASHDFFAYLFKFGSALNTTDRATALNNLKQVFPIGSLPSKSFAKPTMGYNSGTTTFTVTPNYQLRGGATSIDNSNTVIRWYMLKNNVTTGTYPNDALANITLIATTTGNQTGLNISSYPQFTTGGNGVGDEIIAAISVYDNLGQAFPIECATDPRRTI